MTEMDDLCDLMQGVTIKKQHIYFNMAKSDICKLGEIYIRNEDYNNKGLYLTKIITCNVKKWSNRYYFLIFTKTPNDNFKFILGTY